MADDAFKKEIAYYRTHAPELLEKFRNRFVVIKNEQLHGDFESFEEALEYSLQEFGNVPVLIKQVVPDEPVSSFPSLLPGAILANVS